MGRDGNGVGVAHCHVDDAVARCRLRGDLDVERRALRPLRRRPPRVAGLRSEDEGPGSARECQQPAVTDRSVDDGLAGPEAVHPELVCATRARSCRAGASRLGLRLARRVVQAPDEHPACVGERDRARAACDHLSQLLSQSQRRPARWQRLGRGFMRRVPTPRELEEGVVAPREHASCRSDEHRVRGARRPLHHRLPLLQHGELHWVDA
mmetsp:Transcript_16437/g.50367  ORF Transcript_16437/g.50367 Transcript_16437/m.50367 type:complete len:209 (-) Transcript_16437:161-787(-)